MNECIIDYLRTLPRYLHTQRTSRTGGRWASRPGRPGKTKRTVSLLGRARQPSCCVGTAKSVVAGHPKSTGQGRVPRLEQSTQLHTNPSQPPVHSRLLPRPPHCRTGPLPLCDSPGLHCTQAPTYPSAVPISLSPPSSKAQASRVRLFGLPTTLLLLASPTDRVLSSCTIFPLFFLFIPTPPSRPLSLVLLFIIALPPSA